MIYMCLLGVYCIHPIDVKKMVWVKVQDLDRGFSAISRMNYPICWGTQF